MSDLKNYKNIFLKLVSTIPKFGSGICLQRTQLLMHHTINADYLQKTPTIVLTGTDGKGSTSTLIEAILRASGASTGLFTSPHFLDFNERFKVNGHNADYQQLCQIIEIVIAEKNKIEHQLKQTFGVFEILFVVALAVFECNHAKVLIFEAGIGGRYDPVRLLKAKLTALTSVALEHTALLGDSTELIAYDKLDACYPGGTTVIGNIYPSLLAKIKAYSPLKDINIVDSTTIVTADKLSLTVKGFESININTSLTGQSQYYNIQTAVTVCQIFMQKEPPQQFLQYCEQGLNQCHIPGRFDKIGDNPELYIDSAHTPDAFHLLFDTIEQQFNDKPIVFVAGISAGRDNRLLAEKVLSTGCEVIVTSAKFKGAVAQVLFDEVNKNSRKQTVTLEPDLSQALKLAKQAAQRLNARIFVVGGLFLAGEAAAIEKGIEVKDLYLY